MEDRFQKINWWINIFLSNGKGLSTNLYTKKLLVVYNLNQQIRFLNIIIINRTGFSDNKIWSLVLGFSALLQFLHPILWHADKYFYFLANIEQIIIITTVNTSEKGLQALMTPIHIWEASISIYLFISIISS